MLIKIKETEIVNVQQATRLYIDYTFNGYGVVCEMLDHLYTIKECTTLVEAVKILDKILSQYDRGQRVIEL